MFRYVFKNVFDKNKILVSYGKDEKEARKKLNAPKFYRVIKVTEVNSYCGMNFKERR